MVQIDDIVTDPASKMIMMAKVCRFVAGLTIRQNNGLNLTGIKQQLHIAIDSRFTQILSSLGSAFMNCFDR